jgi:hypothetical protein
MTYLWFYPDKPIKTFPPSLGEDRRLLCFEVSFVSIVLSIYCTLDVMPVAGAKQQVPALRDYTAPGGVRFLVDNLTPDALGHWEMLGLL